MPEGVRVRTVEESAQTIYLVLPPTTSRAAQREGGELSDRELEGVAGGGTWSTCQGAVKVAQWC